MASSFSEQIPSIIHLIQQIRPATVLDIGKGFGKYGFLIHEYAGIDPNRKIDPEKSLQSQSLISIDAVEVDPDLMLPHMSQIYRKVYFGDVLEIYRDLPRYDLVLMIDIIEHIEKSKAMEMISQVLSSGARMIIATPIRFFEQELYESKYERHVSHWSSADFRKIGFCEEQYLDSGAIYLLSEKPLKIRGFGNGLMQKFRRLARQVRNEFRWKQ